MQKIDLIKKNDGIRIINCQMPRMSSISTVIGIKAGSIYENSKQQGISHFIEHMLFKGTEKKRNTLEISRCIEELGGEINASTSEECTFLYSKVLHKNFKNALEVMMDILSNSLFREEDINREKAIVIEEINKYQDIPEDWITFLINKLLWKNTVLEQNVLGKKETVKSFNRQLILDYFNEMYHPHNMVISIAGNFTNATDAADYLVKKGIPFRSAHEIIGKLVLYCIQSDKTLECLTIEEYKDISEVFSEDIFEAISLETCVNKRNVIGGPSKEMMKKVIGINEEYLKLS